MALAPNYYYLQLWDVEIAFIFIHDKKNYFKKGATSSVLITIKLLKLLFV